MEKLITIITFIGIILLGVGVLFSVEKVFGWELAFVMFGGYITIFGIVFYFMRKTME